MRSDVAFSVFKVPPVFSYVSESCSLIWPLRDDELFGMRSGQACPRYSRIQIPMTCEKVRQVLYGDGEERVKADLLLEQRLARVQYCSLPSR